MQPAIWHVTVDQNWAVNIAEYRRGRGDLGKFLGGGAVMILIWSGSTLLGHLAAGGVLSDPTAARRLGLDFVGIAVFVVVAAILFRGKRDLGTMTASPENLIAILVMALAAMAAKGGGFLAMRWLGRHRFVAAWLDHAPGARCSGRRCLLGRRGGSRHRHPLAGRLHARPVRSRRRGGLGAMGRARLSAVSVAWRRSDGRFRL